MKRLFSQLFIMIFLLCLLPAPALAAEYLIPGGQIIGLQLQNGSVTIAAFDDVLGASARESGLKPGDEILSVGEKTVTSAEDVRSAVTSQDPVTLCVRRNGKTHTVSLTPRQTPEGPRLGIHLKQGISGVGTISWYDPATGIFGTLGHGVSDHRGTLLNMTAGTAHHAEILSVKKGKTGEPGLLKGTAGAGQVWGSLLRNTPQGVFGKLNQPVPGTPLPTAEFEEIKTGPAVIRSTVADHIPREYSVEILKIYPEGRSNGRNFLIRITDPDLLSATGGIVQGMSGSPIIQDGKLLGAVTHVLVNDPTRGYGIFIENMLEAAK